MNKFLRSALCLILSLSLLLCLCACGEDAPGSASEPVSGSEAEGSDEPYELMEDVGFHEKIPFPDKNLEAAIRKAMNLPDRFDITPMHTSQVMCLDLRGLDIENIDGLQFFTSLEVLYLSDNKIEHLDALESVTELFILDFSGNQVRDVTPILGLSNLMLIDARNNPMEDPGALDRTFDIDKTYVVNELPLVSWE